MKGKNQKGFNSTITVHDSGAVEVDVEKLLKKPSVQEALLKTSQVAQKLMSQNSKNGTV